MHIQTIYKMMNMEEYPTPIQTLHGLKGKEVTVELKSGEHVTGSLIAFDLYTNITVETDNGTRFLQGTSVNFVYGGKHVEALSEKKEEASSEEKEESGHSPDDSPA
jgi:small nuclear ribonucleoprotein (snRNP)-like protein